ncbi:MAG: haloacid dehalogenase-like hydrolase, partial [Burkholderiaceae bacterium]|nr:haloacid dehalogenase-like hydrolase [Burkholderiaceae bacterium]
MELDLPRRALALLLALAGLASTSAVAQPSDPLPSWRDGATKSRLVAFVQAVTELGGKDYVPSADRVAVFDNDGTLWAEQPMYFQLAFAIDRAKALVAKHPGLAKLPALKAVAVGDTRALVATGEKGIAQLLAVTHANRTSEEFTQVVRDRTKSARHPTLKRPYTQLTYPPMRELLDYLRANGFKTYIVSGGGVDFLRVIAEELYGVPPEQVVGSSIKTKYEIRNGQPAIVRLPEVDFIDDRAGKPV